MRKVFDKAKQIVNKRILVSILLVAFISLLAFPIQSSAKMVDVYTMSSQKEHLNLDWAVVYDEKNSVDVNLVGEMGPQIGGNYTFSTNCWGAWYSYDACHFAYTKAAFNTGKDSVMTIQTTLDSITRLKQFGIMVRKNLEADSEMVWLNIDPDVVRIDFREEKATNCEWVNKKISNDRNNKIHFKAVITKGRGLVEYYLKFGGKIDEEEDWSKFLSKSVGFIKSTNALYVGVVAAAGERSLITANFSNFSVNLQAPEGYVVEDGSTDTEDTESKPPEIELPKDMETYEDALFYETFTDGDLFPEEKERTINNFLWTVRTGNPTIEIDDAKKNRFLYSDITDKPLFVETGDMDWTDYSVQTEVVFPKNSVREEINRVRLMIRQRTAYVGGVGYYGVTFYNKIEDGEFTGQYLALEVKQGETDDWIEQSRCKTLAEVKVSSDNMLELGKKHTLKVEVFDNTFKVFLNDMSTPIIDYVDTNTGDVGGKDPYLKGGIGFIIERATVQIDNIVVRKLYDPLGGDYDNTVMGDYDQPTPAWIEKDYMS